MKVRGRKETVQFAKYVIPSSVYVVRCVQELSKRGAVEVFSGCYEHLPELSPIVVAGELPIEGLFKMLECSSQIAEHT